VSSSPSRGAHHLTIIELGTQGLTLRAKNISRTVNSCVQKWLRNRNEPQELTVGAIKGVFDYMKYWQNKLLAGCQNTSISLIDHDLGDYSVVNHIFRSLFYVLTTSKHNRLAQQIKYLKVENEILRSRLPKQIIVTRQERQRLLKFGAKLGNAITALVSIVRPNTFLKWIREDKRSRGLATQCVPHCGRTRTRLSVRRLILKFARENGGDIRESWENWRRSKSNHLPEILWRESYEKKDSIRVQSEAIRPGRSSSKGMPRHYRSIRF
jgi:hypothetical protein